MDKTIQIIALIQIMWLVTVYCNPEDVKSHYGTEFVVGMIPNGLGDGFITIDIASESQGMAELYVPFLNLNSTKTLNVGQTSFNINKTLVKQGNFSEIRGVYIKTTSPVAIYVTNYYPYSLETYLALPTTSLGKTYMVASYQPDSYETSVIAIVSTFPNTTISINNHSSVTLDKLYNYQMVSGSDLTAAEVSSTKPVSVISGSSCSEIPVGFSGCDMIMEQMIPVSMWTNTYIIPPLPPKTGYLARVQTLNSLYICLQNNTDKICRHMMHNSYIEFHLGTEPTVVYTNDSLTFSVTQYGFSQTFDYITGDSFMTVIPGIDNFLPKYNFIVPQVESGFGNYLVVIIKKSDVIGLRLDGNIIQTVYHYKVSRPLDEYIVLVANISTGYHVLSNSDQTVTFGAFLYGLKDYAGYGITLGMKSKTDTSSTQSSKLKCFHCDEMSSLEVCDAVKTCSDNQVCFAEKYTSRSGEFYKSGCILKSQCQNVNTTSSTDVCLECCYGNYCNNKGCGDKRFPDRKDRGPMCYDCQHVLNNSTLCMKVNMCGPDEVCSIEQYKWGSDFHYKMGCTHRLCTPLRRASLPQRLRRSTPVCSTCCADDFCNANCPQTTNNPTGQIIVG